MKTLFPVVLLAVALFAVAPAGAVDPAETLADPAMEARARDIGKNLRCLVCQNQSIDDSDAQLARDLRLLVRERIKSGDADSAVIDYVVSRYGDFVLLNPPLKGTTLVLWLGPAAIGFAALAAGAAFYRRRKTEADAAKPAPLSEAEKRRLVALLDGKDR